MSFRHFFERLQRCQVVGIGLQIYNCIKPNYDILVVTPTIVDGKRTDLCTTRTTKSSRLPVTTDLALGKEVLHRGVALPTRQLDQQETPTTPTTNSLFSSGTSSRAGERERVFSSLLVLEHEG